MANMHRTGLSPELIGFMNKRRGAVHIHEPFAPAGTDLTGGNATGGDLFHTGAPNGLFAMFADVMIPGDVLPRLEIPAAHAIQ